MTLAEFRRTYPAATFTVSSGKLFTYRYYQNPQAKATLVLLTGGIGLSDLFYKHFARFARDFSVLTFDYQLQFGDNGEFADAVAELLRHLKEKVWLVGQSLGGVVAQVIASRHPEVVEGLIRYLQANGFQDLTIMEGSWVGDKTIEAYEVCGYRELTEKYQVPFWDMQKDKGIERDCRGMKLNVCERAANIDFLINVPVLKGHCQTKITCALKNMKGLIPNTEKRHFHAMGLHEPIAHLNAGLHQDFVVVDNICGDLDFEDGGNPVVMNRIWAGTDPVLIDSYVCQIMHYTTKDVPYIELAEKLGVGSTDLKNSRIIYCEENARKELPKSRKVVELQDAVEEVESCSACYGYLIPALEMLKNDGLFEKLDTKICIGQGYRGKTGKLGVGACTCKFEHNVKGCPPTENQIYDFLKQYILGENK